MKSVALWPAADKIIATKLLLQLKSGKQKMIKYESP